MGLSSSPCASLRAKLAHPPMKRPRGNPAVVCAMDFREAKLSELTDIEKPREQRLALALPFAIMRSTTLRISTTYLEDAAEPL